MSDDKDRSITWKPRAKIELPKEKTKTKTDRAIPISARLKSILEMRRLHRNGEPLALTGYVFGNEIGQPVNDVGRAWETAVLKSRGHNVVITGTGNLSPESRAALASIDLHFHDLRGEAGSRWVEGGVPLHTVRDWLGHTSIAQTSTYLGTTLKTQHDAVARFDEYRERLQKLANSSRKGGRKSR